MADYTFIVNLVIDELIYDIDNKAYLTGRSRKDSAGVETVASMQSSDSDEDRNQILRSIQNAYNQLRVAVSEYLTYEADKESEYDDKLLNDDTTSAIDLSFTVPGNFNTATRAAIAAIAHKYIVNKALAEWFLITNKADVAEYEALAAQNAEELRVALNKRVRPKRQTT
jgi:hypothetical protein